MNKEYKYRQDIIVNHPITEEKVFWDLVERYHKYGTLYIGVDFDDTLYPFRGHRYPTILVNLLRNAKKVGFKLCLFTLPIDDDNLEWKIQWCKDQGIEMDYINTSPIFAEESLKYGKPFFNLLLDDRATIEGAYRVLWNLIEYIDSK